MSEEQLDQVVRMLTKRLNNKFMAEDIKTTDETSETSAETKTATPAAAAATVKRKKGAKVKVTKGKVYVQSTYNNTIVTITDVSGNVISWGSAGLVGFKGSKKSTPYAAQKTMEDTIQRVKDRGLQEVDVLVKGIGSGRESAVRALQSSGLTVLSIKDHTPIPHGGVRPKKVRRV
jgi:small subunit ribosomal protein S11